MPEFHLRGKKKKKTEPEAKPESSDYSRQLQRAALDLYEEHNEIILGPNEISVDEAVAGRRVNVADEQIIKSTTSSSEPLVKGNVVRKISSKYSECLYLRYGSEMRRCPMPSPITLTTIRQLFVNLFDLSPMTIDDPCWHLFILDRANTWKPLEFIAVVYDHCTILLVDSSDVGTLIPSPVSLYTHPSRCSTGTPDNELLFTPSPNDLRPLSWRSSSDDLVPRPKSLDISMLPSVTGDDASTRPLDCLSPLSVQDSVDGVYVADSLHRHSFAMAPRTPLRLQMLGMYNRVQHLQHELTVTREEHRMRMNEIQLQFQMSKEKLLAAVKGFTVPSSKNTLSFRQERIALEKIKEDYLSHSNRTQQDLSLLQAVIEELRVDAVERRCKIDCNEIDALLSELKEHQSSLQSLQGRYLPFGEKLKEVMRNELTVIVQEEQFVEEEPNKLEEGKELCSQLLETLQKLKQYSSVQKQRSPHVPFFAASVEETDRSALMMSIANIVPNHTQRAENIKIAEDVQRQRRLKLSPSRRALKEFEQSLQNQQKKLNTTNNLEELESRLESKVKAFYMDEKLKRQQELEKELLIKEEMKKKRKHKEIEMVRAKIKREEEHLKQVEERQKVELKLEKEKLEKERRKNEEERKKLEKIKKEQEDERRKNVELKRQAEEEQRKKEQDRIKQLEENIRLELIENEKEERKKMEKERLRQVEETLRKEIEREKMEERKKFEEEHKLFDELLSSDSPRLKARRKDLMWNQIQERARLEIEEEQRITTKHAQLRSQQMVMDSLTPTSGSTPVFIRKDGSSNKISEYSNSFNGHHSSPYLHRQDNAHAPDRGVMRFHHLESSFSSAPTHRKLVPSLSTDLKTSKEEEPSYDTLEKLCKSEENMNQNHYDLPWNSKKLPVGGVQRRGTFGSSPGEHRRNKSEGISDIVQTRTWVQQRENLTPSPAFHHSYTRTSQTPPPKKSSFSSLHKAQSPVYDDVTPRNQISPNGNGLPSDSPSLHMLASKSINSFTSENGLHSSSFHKNGVLPSYSQVIQQNTPSPTNGHRQRSQTTHARISNYPLASNPAQKQKPSISYV